MLSDTIGAVEIEMTLNENEYQRTFPLYFGNPIQSNIVPGIPEASFILDARVSALVVASVECDDVGNTSC